MVSSINSRDVSTTDSAPPTTRQKLAVSMMCLFAFLLLYFMMSGPLVWIEDKMKFKPFTRSVETVYKPLVVIVKSDMKPASSAIKAYVGMFK
ncbi:hypothetical protein [Gimesia aquarii]|uniref:Uncharacterized protein n=1 Tax=Gimesia aquarii TaxID=2527964 RepID=A0A517W0P2_9PLAN|nr:hypothetical protein [Gimesia aquarii]QDT98809.1 hypothetical protein V144x_43170 [Gimesia aquarii]